MFLKLLTDVIDEPKDTTGVYVNEIPYSTFKLEWYWWALILFTLALIILGVILNRKKRINKAK